LADDLGQDPYQHPLLADLAYCLDDELEEEVRSSFDKAFEIVVGLEGHISNDPRDPGGLTVWGLASRYNPGVSPAMTIEQAKKVYLEKYWILAGCDDVPYPMDVCLFDSQVNPQNDPKWNYGGNKEIMNLNPETWQDYLLLRMIRYMRNSKDCYVKGHIFRALKLYQIIKEVA
jgi:hypothetical protein